jgi:hypothetical protein
MTRGMSNPCSWPNPRRDHILVLIVLQRKPKLVTELAVHQVSDFALEKPRSGPEL